MESGGGSADRLTRTYQRPKRRLQDVFHKLLFDNRPGSTGIVAVENWHQVCKFADMARHVVLRVDYLVLRLLVFDIERRVPRFPLCQRRASGVRQSKGRSSRHNVNAAGWANGRPPTKRYLCWWRSLLIDIDQLVVLMLRGLEVSTAEFPDWTGKRMASSSWKYHVRQGRSRAGARWTEHAPDGQWRSCGSTVQKLQLPNPDSLPIATMERVFGISATPACMFDMLAMYSKSRTPDTRDVAGERSSSSHLHLRK